MDAFGTPESGQALNMATYLDQSSFDEKFEIDLTTNTLDNIYHVENKYYVPVLHGSYPEMYDFAKEYMLHPDDIAFNDFLNPEKILENFKNSPEPGFIKAECREKLIDGSYRWVQYFGLYGTENGVPEGKVYFYVFDIQNQKDRINKTPSSNISLVERDELTGLLKRERFIEYAQKKAQNSRDTWCCLAIDIQNFKIFNHWFGQEKGNYLLAGIGATLKQFAQEHDAVAAYFNRDNFTVFCRYDKEPIRELFETIKEQVFFYSSTMGFVPAIGVNVIKDSSQITLDIYEKARIAVESAKKTYNHRIKHFDEELYNERRNSFILITEFQNALKNDEITFYLQPQCNTTTGNIVGAEAIARWIKEDGTIIPPATFVPFLEETGFVSELDKCVWEAVCKWIRSIIDRNKIPSPISINVSQIDLITLDVASFLYGLTQKYNIPPRLINVEITESAYAENTDLVRKNISDLKAKGFKVFMDDFGAGYSSLSMLDQANVNLLKLDMAFMRKNESMNKKGISIIESIFGLTKTLGLPVIVEGVETESQVTFLKNLGCKYCQGFFYYKPMPIAEFESLMENEALFERNSFEKRSVDLFSAREFLNEGVFTNTVLNNIIGAVAFYSLENKNLTIDRYNEQFRKAIGDANMDSRTIAIQNYVVKEDWPSLYRALDEAVTNVANGGNCEIRFYKSDDSVFWFKMHFYFIREENNKQYFCGQVEDITELRKQSIHFLEVLRKQSAVTMRINIDQRIVQYVVGDSTLYQPDFPSVNLSESIQATAANRIGTEIERQQFIDFFNVDRLEAMYRKAIYHETLTINFKVAEDFVKTEFSTYYIRYNKDQELIVYVFTKILEQ